MTQRAGAAMLSAAAFKVLRRCCPALVLSVDADAYARSTYSWLVAVDAQTLRFAVDGGGGTSANLARDGRATLQVIGQGGLSLLLRGPVRRLASTPPALAELGMEAWQLQIAEQTDQAWPGVRTSSLRYRAADASAVPTMRQLGSRIGAGLLG